MNVRQENCWLFLFSASSFSFSQPENCHIFFFSRLFFPQPWKLSEDTFMLWIKSILILSLITLCVNCRCLIICLPCSVPSFFLRHGFLFAFYLEQHPIVCPLKFRIMGYFSLSIVHWSISSTPAVIIIEHAEMHGIKWSSKFCWFTSGTASSLRCNPDYPQHCCPES
jgi:hypothetical protein